MHYSVLLFVSIGHIIHIERTSTPSPERRNLMKASYKVRKTCDHLVRMGTAPYIIEYFVGDDQDWDYERRCKHFHETEAAAHKAGKRYLKKMQKNGFEI